MLVDALITALEAPPSSSVSSAAMDVKASSSSASSSAAAPSPAAASASRQFILKEVTSICLRYLKKSALHIRQALASASSSKLKPESFAVLHSFHSRYPLPSAAIDSEPVTLHIPTIRLVSRLLAVVAHSSDAASAASSHDVKALMAAADDTANASVAQSSFSVPLFTRLFDWPSRVLVLIFVRLHASSLPHHLSSPCVGCCRACVVRCAVHCGF